jgi:uncharacterized protein (DUF1800 family)
LWFRFASGSPLEPATRDRLTTAYRTGRDVNALLRALFTDEAFARTRGHLVKQPVEWLIGAMRQLELTPAQFGADQRRTLRQGLDGLGQVPLRPPSVAGWPAGAAWLNTSSLQVRIRLAGALAAQAGPGVLRGLSTGTEATKVAELARLLSVDAWTDRTRNSLSTAAGRPRTLLAAGLTSPEYTTV